MTISQRTAGQRHPQGFYGKPAFGQQNARKRTLINETPQAVQINTVTVTDPGDNTDVTIVINGVPVTVNTATGLDAAGIVLLLVAAINADPLVRGQVAASASSADLILTGLLSGRTFTVDDSDGALSDASTQSASAADGVPFGRVCLITGVNIEEDQLEYLGGLAKSSLMTAQVDQLGVAYVASSSYLVTVTIEGVGSWSVSVAADTDQDTTITAVAAALNAILPANTVVVTDNDSGSNDADALILTAEIAGLEFSVSYGASDGGASIPAFTHTSNAGLTTSVLRAFGGISLWTLDEEATSVAGGEAVYPANAGIKVLVEDAIWVENAQGVSFGDAVYLELASGADSGKLFNTSSATRILLPGWRWEIAGHNSTHTLAAVRIPH